MKNLNSMGKKIVSFMLAIAMVMFAFYGTDVNTVANASQAKATTIYYCDGYMSHWDNAYAYVWNGTGSDVKCFKAVKCVEESQSSTSGSTYKVWKFNLDKQYDNVIFKNTAGTNNWDKQTGDLKVPTNANTMYYCGVSLTGKQQEAWRTPFSFIEGTVTPTPTVKPTPTVTPTVAPTKATTVYYCDGYMTHWANAYAYVWNGTGSDVKCFAAVKCVERSQSSTSGSTYKVWKFNLDKQYDNVIFKNTAGTNNWDKQTGDLKVPTNANTMYYCGVSLTGKQQTFWEAPFSFAE